MKIRLDRIGVLEDIIPANTVLTFPTDDLTVGDLVEAMSEKHKKTGKGKLFSRGELKERCIILVNGRNIRSLRGLQTSLRDGDTVFFAVPVTGG